jgi:hypothetical protein
MARTIHRIKVKKGKVDKPSEPVTPNHLVVWEPDSVDDTVDIYFQNGSPFKYDRLTAPYPGVAIGAIVTVTPSDTTEYFYGTPNVLIKTGPEIIVDPGKKKNGPKRKPKSRGRKGKKGRGSPKR